MSKGKTAQPEMLPEQGQKAAETQGSKTKRTSKSKDSKVRFQANFRSLGRKAARLAARA